MITSSDKLELDSEASISSFSYSIANIEEEEEEEIEEDEDDTKLQQQPPSHLHCHPDDELPKVAICMCEQLYHAECNRCKRCSKQCVRGKVFLKEVDNDHNMTILCMECAKEIGKERIFCQVCLDEIKKDEISNKKERKNKAVELRKGFFVHKDCLHCQICGFSERKSFQCVKNKAKDKKYIICLDCASIMNGGGASKNIAPFVGRFIDDILPDNFCKQCQLCHQKLTCNGFIFESQRILCINCGKSLFLEKKMRK